MFQQADSIPRHFFRSLLLMLLLLALTTGCAQLQQGANDRDNGDAAEESHPEPYNPSGFDDLLIPSELTWLREKSMVINTDSYAGGILYFSGRVNVNSLTDFFVATMKRDDWKLVGSVKYQNVMLAYIKPHQACTIIIKEGALLGPTEVQIHIANDLTRGEEGDSTTPATAVPFSF